MKRYWLILIAIVVFATSALATPNVEVYFTPVVQTVERNSYALLTIQVSSNETIQVDGLDTNVRYDTAIFTGPLIHSSIGTWMVTNENTSANGRIVFQKGGNAAGELLQVTAGIPRTLCTIELKVKNDAALTTSSVTFERGFINITAQGYSDTLITTYNTALVGVRTDTTAPITRAVPGAGLYNAAQNIVLGRDPSDRSDDLREIHYTLSDHPGVTPSIVSPLYTGPIFVPIESVRYIMFMGVDSAGNQEMPQSALYRVDASAPQITGLIVTPNKCGRGQRVQVSFAVNEPLSGGVPTSVNIGGTPMVVSDNVYPDYSYYYDVLSSDTQGTRNVEIIIRDLAGNQTIDRSRSVYFDFIPPVFSNPRVSALSLSQVYLIFDASEQLDTARTVVSVSGNVATFVSSEGNTYRYRYTKLGTEGSNLILVNGYDLAGNYGVNTEGWNVVTVRGRDIYNNPGEGTVTVNIIYPAIH